VLPNVRVLQAHLIIASEASYTKVIVSSNVCYTAAKGELLCKLR
jgi:hypothetical protein